ncbi:polar amino acid transport system substrate-binding protein [Pseudarthrobacter defluvii]|uniref:ABC transporter substrate-binding protein n=1 Tax=Pseudarthrobacter defluvii TaxID=410837 RepID=UPI0027841B38|nr:ABC transporter substrate-binding protein [Pseudarthrobacter defluvii]MDQ0767995.1 polar amino acid transport system substrate-binding protein [Pseudarthrobacter defluvii]
MIQFRSMFATVAAVSMASVLLSGCSNPEMSSSAQSDAPKPSSSAEAVKVDEAAAAALPKEAKDRGTLTVTMSQSSPPLHFMAPDGTTTIGVDPEIAMALGQTLGLKTEVKSGPFDGIIPGISAGKFDMAVSQMSPSTERMKVLDFVDYYQSGSGIGVAPGNPEKLTIDTLCGKRVGVLKGSFQDLKRLPALSKACTDAGKPAIEAMTYPDMQAPNLALTAGRIDAVYIDGPTLGYAIKQGGQIELLGEKDVSPVSIGFKKGAGLEKAIQLGMESLAKSGKYKEILDKWGVGSGAISDFAFNKAQ